MREPAFVSACTVWIVCAWLCLAVFLVFKAFAFVVIGRSLLQSETDIGTVDRHIRVLLIGLLSFVLEINALLD